MKTTTLLTILKVSPGGSVVENSPANAGDMGSILGSRRSLEKEMATHFLPGWSHGQRSLVGYSPSVAKESDTI